MYGSLKGRYTEHILRHQLPEDLLTRPICPKNNVDLAEGRWAKRGSPRQTKIPNTMVLLKVNEKQKEKR